MSRIASAGRGASPGARRPGPGAGPPSGSEQAREQTGADGHREGGRSEQIVAQEKLGCEGKREARMTGPPNLGVRGINGGGREGQRAGGPGAAADRDRPSQAFRSHQAHGSLGTGQGARGGGERVPSEVTAILQV